MKPSLPAVLYLFLLFMANPSYSQPNIYKPEIMGQTPNPLTTPMNQSISVNLENLIVQDRDPLPVYPDGFTLEVSSGKNYEVDDATITPDNNFIGMLSVPVRVNDGQRDSKKFNVQIEVTGSLNAVPVITGQQALNIDQGESIEIELSHLSVNDPDNAYPDDFTLNVFNGNNYTRNRSTISPNGNFTGTLTVGVSVHDGQNESEKFDLKINVMPADNIPPVITGQKSISLIQNSPLLILLSHLIVTDPDNNYPIGFSLTVLPGDDYSVEGATITPLPNFENATLIVKVMVSDGIADSKPFDLKIQIIPATSTPTINGQRELTMLEDSSMTITLSHLEVTDTDNPDYPKGFSLKVLPGNRNEYTVSGHTVTPALDLNGFIEVGVTVSDGISASAEFKLSILVIPVNDAPEILNLETTALLYEPGGEPIHLSQTIDIWDVDNDHLSMAEIGFKRTNFSAANDQLIVTTDSTNIKAIYDPEGILFLVGYAPLEEYKGVLRSLQYNYQITQDENGNPSEILSGTRTVYMNLHDGQLISDTHERQITMETKVFLDIPNAFTPNGDNSNDTWRIHAVNKDQLDKAVIRVYNKRGFLLYESVGFENEWDGTSNGDALPVDTYYYTIDLNLSYMKQIYKGAVTILH